MNNFPEFESESMGGCESFKFSPLNNVSSLPTAVSLVISSSPVFRSGSSWLDGLAIRDSLHFTETMEGTPSGKKYKTLITGMVPKLTSSYLVLFEEMKRHKHLVQISDNNGKKRLCGNLLAGMTFNYNQDSGNAPAMLNGYQYTFTREYIEPSPFYTAVLASPGPAPASPFPGA